MTTHPVQTRAPRRDAAENREALIQAAATLLNRDPGASLDTIAAEAGLSRRSIYGHFATRDDLLREVALHGAARINAAVLSQPAPVESQDPATQLALLGTRLWNEVDSIRTMALITLRGSQQQVAVEALDPLRARVRQIVARGVADGSFRPDIAVDRLARLVENAAIAVLEEGVRHELSSDEGRRLVAISVLALAGLGHADASLAFERADTMLEPNLAEPNLAEPNLPGPTSSTPEITEH